MQQQEKKYINLIYIFNQIIITVVSGNISTMFVHLSIASLLSLFLDKSEAYICKLH